MKEKTKQAVDAALADWAYLKELPTELEGFSLRRDMCVEGDMYDIFSYICAARRCKFTVYYHEETKEYKARVSVGLTEFCDIDFITDELAVLEAILRERLAKTLQNLVQFNRDAIDSIVVEKQILEWPYAATLPETLEGFTLFIRPSEPLRVINGSYIVFDYSDFAAESNFIIYYNIFRDEFFGEAKIRRIPEMNYLFDSHTLEELEAKLEAHFLPRLREIRARLAEEEKV